MFWYCGGRSKRQTQWVWRQASERLLFKINIKIKCPKGIKCPKQTGDLVSSSCCEGCEGGAVFWKEGSRAESGGHTRSPLRSGAQGAAASPAASSSFGPRRFQGLNDSASWPVSRLTGAALNPSTLPSWTHEDTSVHARGRDRSPEERRTRHITAAVMRLHSLQVCLITRRQPWLFQRPSSLTHPLPSGAWWRAAIKGRGDADN